MQTEAKTIKDEQEEEEREDGVVEEEKDTKIDQEMAPIDNSPQQQSTGSVNANSKKFRRLDRNKKRSGLRVPGEPDVIAKLERSRQSARECRARKKLRYQYLEDLVTKRENAVFLLRKELDSIKDCCKMVDHGKVPNELKKFLNDEDRNKDKKI